MAGPDSHCSMTRTVASHGCSVSGLLAGPPALVEVVNQLQSTMKRRSDSVTAPSSCAAGAFVAVRCEVVSIFVQSKRKKKRGLGASSPSPAGRASAASHAPATMSTWLELIGCRSRRKSESWKRRKPTHSSVTMAARCVKRTAGSRPASAGRAGRLRPRAFSNSSVTLARALEKGRAVARLQR